MSSLVSPASTRYREPVTEWAAPRKVNFATEKDLLVSVQVPAGNAQPAVTVSDNDDGGPTRLCSPPNDSAGLLLDYRTIPSGMQSPSTSMQFEDQAWRSSNVHLPFIAL